MKKFLMLIFSSIMFCGCSLSTSIMGEKITFDSTATISDIASQISPAVVGIGGIKRSSESVGSGVCVSSKGYIVTNSHVVNDCDKIVLYLSNGKTTNASLVYEDSVLDFAILKSNQSLPYLILADSDELCVGEDILAVGTPLSLTLTHTFTKGIISALNRTLKVSSDEGEGFMQNLIQHDASLNPGNSGGPLVNNRGEIVGINTLKISGGEGIGFAIPTKSFRSLLKNFIDEEDYSVPYLGVYGVDCEIAKFQGVTNEDKGFYVIDISSTSPLKISKNSIIVKFNGREIKDTLDLKDELFKCKSLDIVEIEYISEGKLYKTITTLGSIEKLGNN